MDFERIYYKISQSYTVEELREFFSWARLEAGNELREWGEFFEKFNVPKKNKAVLSKRMLLNLKYYRVNYAFVFAGVLSSISIAWALRTLLVAAFSFGLGFHLFHLRKRFPVVTFGHEWTIQNKAACFGGSVFLFSSFLGAVWPTVLTLALSFVFIAGHAVLRPKSTRSEFTSFGEEINLEAGVSVEASTYTPPATHTPFVGTPNNYNSTIQSSPVAMQAEIERMRTQYESKRARNEEFSKQRRQVNGGDRNNRKWMEEEAKEGDGPESRDDDLREREIAMDSIIGSRKAPVQVKLHVPGAVRISSKKNE